jgi:hypothetical protein
MLMTAPTNSSSDYDYDVFLSHNSKDKTVVEEIGTFLEEKGIRVWLDKWEIDFGESIPHKVNEGVTRSRYLLLFLSKHFADSDWGNYEHQTVQFVDPLNKEGRVLSCKIDEAPPPDHIAPFRFFDYHADSGEALQQLLNKLEGKPLKPGFAEGHKPDSRVSRRGSIPQIPGGPFKLSGLPNVETDLFGRDPEQDALDAAWKDARPSIVGLIGEGGQGKSVLLHTWLNDFRRDDLRGAKCVLVHSFYRQTTGIGGSSDDFLSEAFACLDLEEKADEKPRAKAIRLVKELRKTRALLILDGVEPLQVREGESRNSKFADDAIHTLLLELACGFNGLCLISSQRPLIDLHRHFASGEYRELPILPVEFDDATKILIEAGVIPSGAAIEIARRAGGHGLTLKILGRAIANFIAGDATRLPELLSGSDRGTTELDLEIVLEAIDQRLAPAQRCLLRLVGLFETPARLKIISVFRETEAIEGVTEPLEGITAEGWIELADSLRAHGLLWPVEETDEDELDAHPRIRQFFGARLKDESEEGWRECHSRLFDQLCTTTEQLPDDLPGLQPLYQAVTHGCLAGRQQEADAEVYFKRIQRGAEAYSTHKLGAIGSDLGALAAFFEEPWRRLSPNLSESNQAWLLNEAAFSLRALGRLTEAIEPMRIAVEKAVETENWREATIRASNLSELEATLGLLGDAVTDGRRAIDFADRSGDAFHRESKGTTAADALHQSGDRAGARALFEEAERMQAESQPGYPLLYSVQGFQYVDLLLAEAERAAWRAILECGGLTPLSIRDGTSSVQSGAEFPGGVNRESQSAVKPAHSKESALAACAEAERRASQTLEWVTTQNWLLDIALDHLSLAQARLYRAILSQSEIQSLSRAESRDPESEIDATLNGLREAGQQQYLPLALLTAAMGEGTRDEGRGMRDEG